MPGLQQAFAVVLYHCHDTADLVRAEPSALGDFDGFEPDLDRRGVAIDVDMRRLVGFVAEELEAERADPQDGGHQATLSPTAHARP
jgi:hypothetical protein